MELRFKPISAPEFKRGNALYSLLVLLAVLLFCLPAMAQIALIEYVQGEAMIGKNRPLTEGAILKKGQRIRTGMSGRVLVRYADDSTMLIKEESEIKIVEVSRRRNGISLLVDLIAGEVDNVVSPRADKNAKYHIRTRSALTGVRGTSFRVMTTNEGKETITEVLEGEVDFRRRRDGRSIPLLAGQGSLIAPNRPLVQPIALLPAPKLLGFVKRQYRSTVRIEAEPIPGADYYRLEIATTPTFEGLVYQATLGQPSRTIHNFDDGHYYLRLKAVSSEGVSGVDTIASFEVTNKPEPPFTLSPSKDAVMRTETVHFEWTQGMDVAGYRLRVAKDVEFKEVVIDETISNHRAPIPLEAGEYFWQVATIRNKDTGPFGDPVNFTVISPKVTDIQIFQLNDTQQTVTWSSEGANRYEFQLARDRRFDEILMSSMVDDTQITLNLDEPGVYYLRVRSFGFDGKPGPYSEIQRLEYWRPFPWWILLILGAGI